MTFVNSFAGKARGLLIAAAVAATSALPAAASTVGFEGAFWDTGAFSTIDDAIAHAEANDATATFTSTSVDYPRGSRNVTRSRTTLADYLADDAASLSGAGSTQVVGSIFKFSGVIDVAAGMVNFIVGSDDGYRLFIDDVVVSEQVTPRAFRETSVDVNVSGPVSFTLYYFENYGATGVEFWANKQIVDQSLAVVPLPASGMLSIAALAGLALVARRRKQRG